MKKEKKDQATFTISSSILNEFKKLSNQNALNMSKFVQNKIEEYVLKENSKNDIR